ncbi:MULTISPECIES: glycosyltransferase family 4 protein [Bradyrhizobium]|uniref:glycosyltransferase family 4 protein n=1 Tax=Bradyrhizobium TaxID=374 RepID=UPI000485119C|nr:MULTISPECIES: glycosyltransferase family 1 protein [Bradyrhizobium]MCS3451029.1 glycosyltransferase involved in cell wall biosynthesis [Bradyrhizobium elkanii]MCS3557825.1 glycosyltransferase involved in cell wall biosynthesis [Bradyrhizobium elkanii]MCW2152328.1 glycosyltransferase involved in cell wall biosynthesis [Bradyrhizobium elkanii]MCW2357796.1 glycosyltransferase involved in cell wall biosynthesis [Bradyrhizobium elkanii]MCW2376058.1 glycosyltransferase involved in cell wall biosy
MTPRPLRFAFSHISRRLWAGGYNYQRNLFAALARFLPGEFVPIVFAGTRAEENELAELAAIPGVEVVRSEAFDGQPGLAAALGLGLDRGAAAAFRDAGIDVVVESARFFGWRLARPAVAWIPDLQHRSLPQLFPATARWRRELGFRMQIASGRTIMLSSESALRDFKAYYPGARNKVCVVRFATQPPAAFLNTDPSDVIAAYDLPANYFYLPNQFYRHKNHQLVVDALTILKGRAVDVVICASGSKEDRREPGYYDLVNSEIQKRGLEAHFRHLGVIPLPHVYALLRASTALINPSRFEGWSTTVEEAKSFGVPMILSDIDVHREQTAGSARYFGVDDPVALADHLMQAAQDAHGPIIRNVVPHQDDNVSAFAASFAATMRQVAGRERGEQIGR